MIARPKISRNEWKAAELGAFEVGNFALLSCPGGYVLTRATLDLLEAAWAAEDPTCSAAAASKWLQGNPLCGNQPLVSGVPTKLQNSLVRSNRSRFG